MSEEHIAKTIRLVLAGHTDRFEDLYQATIHDVYRTLYLLSGSERESDDIAQNIYLELYRCLSSYDPSRSFHAWVYGITMRQYSAYKRRRWREYRKLRKAHEARAADSHIIHPPEVMLGEENMLDELNRLSDKQRQVIVLRYVNELSQQEIADALSIPIGTVKSRLNQGLCQMRKTLGRDINAETN